MIERSIHGETHFEACLRLTFSTEADCLRFFDKAPQAEEGVELAPLFPAPKPWPDPDPLALVSFYRYQGREDEANSILQELGLEVPPPGYNMSSLEIAEALEVADTVTERGTATYGQWLKNQWGCARLPYGVMERLSDTTIQLTAKAEQSILSFFYNVAGTAFADTAECLWVDFSAKKQGKFSAVKGVFVNTEVQIEPLSEEPFQALWIDNINP